MSPCAAPRASMNPLQPSGSNDRGDVEATVGALLDREFLSIGPVTRNITPLEGESAMRGQKRRPECDGRYR